MTTLNHEVRKLVGSVLGRTIGIDENPSRASESRWDSLKHVEIVFLLEDHFGAWFTENDLQQMNDVEEITRTVENRLKSA